MNNLGVYLDSGLVMDRQVSIEQTMSSYFHLRRLRTVRRSLTKESLLTLVHAFVTSRVDHCNGFLFGSHSYLLDRLQLVLNSAARLVLNIPKFSNISAAIRDELHWLPIRRRIDFKIAPYGPSLLGWCCAGIGYLNGIVPNCWLSRRSTVFYLELQAEVPDTHVWSQSSRGVVNAVTYYSRGGHTWNVAAASLRDVVVHDIFVKGRCRGIVGAFWFS